MYPEVHNSLWVLFLICTVWGLSSAVGADTEKTETDQHNEEEITVKRDNGHFLVNLQHSLNVRRLLSANETTAAPPDKGHKSVWEEIEDFYSDNNNMAMYCVLPLIVLVYGGCSAIYCVYKCRRYIRRRKHKKLRNEDESLVAEDERNDLNQEADTLNGGQRQPIKTVSGTNWDDVNNSSYNDVSGYNVQRKKTPLPWETPQKIQRQDSFAENERAAVESRDLSTASGESTHTTPEQELEMLDRKHGDDALTTPPPPPPPPPHQGRVEQLMKERKMEEMRHMPSLPKPPPPMTKATDFSRFANVKPIEIVPISQKEYQRHMMESRNSAWDPLHNRPFESRAGSAESVTDRRSGGRESAWSIRDEIMAKYDALTSLAMAKKTADVLRVDADSPNLNNTGHHPDTLRRKAGKKKLIFIAE